MSFRKQVPVGRLAYNTKLKNHRENDAWPCGRSSGHTTNSGCWRNTTIESPPRCDATSSFWSRQRRSEYRQTTVQEPWGATRPVSRPGAGSFPPEVPEAPGREPDPVPRTVPENQCSIDVPDFEYCSNRSTSYFREPELGCVGAASGRRAWPIAPGLTSLRDFLGHEFIAGQASGLVDQGRGGRPASLVEFWSRTSTQGRGGRPASLVENGSRTTTPVYASALTAPRATA